MTTKSLPSKKIVFANAPEVSNFKAQFDYNFFMADEKTNESGQTSPKYIYKREGRDFDDSFVKSINFQTRVPRLIRFDWKPVLDTGVLNSIPTRIAGNLGKIHNEQNFNFNDFTNLDFQDTFLDQRLNFFLERALKEIQKGFAGSQESPLEIARTLNSLTPDTIRGSFLASILVNLSNLGVTFVTKQNRQSIANTLAAQITKAKSKIIVNNRVIKKVLHSASENTTSIFEDEAKSMMEQVAQIEQRAIDVETSSIMTEREFDLEVVDYIGVRPIDVAAGFNATVQPIGYIIEKQELLTNGNLLTKESIIIDNPLASTSVDLRVKYDATYFYTIKSVAFVEVQAQDFETDELVAISFLVCSNKSEIKKVKCIETVPPPPPWDFNIAWDFKNTAARITWSFPTNSQRDIKYFQLFRRKTIEEPFELIRQYNFDDSEIRSQWTETPDSALVETLSSPKSYYLDTEFGKDSRFIYAVCSVDAHGISSNYSMQLEVSFDRFKNKIEKSLVSVAGAPKAYPNMYLNRDTFVDTIKDSSHSELEIVFNPEYLDVFDSSANNLKLIRNSTDSFYKLSLINVDLQKEQSINIEIHDRRTENDTNNLEKLIEVI